MFQTVGRARKVNRRRQAGAWLMSLLMLSGSMSALLLTGRQIVEEVEDNAPIEVTFLDDAAPPPPPPPPPARGLS